MRRAKTSSAFHYTIKSSTLANPTRPGLRWQFYVQQRTTRTLRICSLPQEDCSSGFNSCKSRLYGMATTSTGSMLYSNHTARAWLRPHLIEFSHGALATTCYLSSVTPPHQVQFLSGSGCASAGTLKASPTPSRPLSDKVLQKSNQPSSPRSFDGFGLRCLVTRLRYSSLMRKEEIEKHQG